MKIKHKLLLHTTILLALLSAAIITATLHLANKSRETVLMEMQARFRTLQALSNDQFEKARTLAYDGVSEASGLEAIDRVIQTANDSHRNFLNLINKEVGKAHATIDQTMIDQAGLATASLEAQLTNSVNFITRMLEADREITRLLANVSISNIGSLKSASLESLKRLGQERGLFTDEVMARQRKLNDEIDKISAELLLALADNDISLTAYQNLIIERMEQLKAELEAMQEKLYSDFIDRVDLQQRVLAEEIRLSSKKIEWAIDREQELNAKLNEQESDEAMQQLRLAHGRIKDGISESSDQVNQTLQALKQTLREQLQARSLETGAVLAEKAIQTRSEAEAAKVRVGQRITDNNLAARQLFDQAVVEAQQVVEKSLLANKRRTVATAFLITAICVMLGFALSVVMVRNLMDPISRVMQFARQLASGDRAGRLLEGNDEMGVMSRALNTMSDELLRLEQATIDSFVQTLDQVLDCIFMLDPDTFRFTYVNQGAIDHLGYDREQILEMTPLDIGPEFSRESLREMLLPLKDDPSQSRFLTTVHQNSKGEEIPVEVLIRYVVPPGNQPRYIAIVRDITEKVRERQEKEQMQAELLHRQKLESVGQLAAGIAHEINTPTQYIGTNIEFLGEACKAINGFVRDLRAKAVDWPEAPQRQLDDALEQLDWEYLEEELPHAIDQSQDGVRRVASLVMAMKRFSHPGTRELDLADLREVVNTALMVTSNEWKYSAEVETFFADDVPKIPILIDEIGQVLLNLIINSVHAIKEKQGIDGKEEKGTITISTAWRGPYVELQFRDTGIGIPRNILPKVFDPFFTTKEVGKGTGQGLAISRDVIVKKHGGEISVQSEAGVGTTFTILLPVKPRDEV